jgi:simple sugar transport system permease protein
MDWGSIIGLGALVPLLNAGVRLAIPTALAAVGECLAERAGVLNLGLEGMMLSGALASFLGVYYTGSVVLGVACGIGAGMVLGGLMAFLSVVLRTEQVINGIAIVLFAQGIIAFAYEALFGAGTQSPRIEPLPDLAVPLLSGIPGIGPVLFEQDALAYFGLAVIGAVAFVLYRTRFGLSIRAVGEMPAAADAVAVSVQRVRSLALLACGGLAGLGGAVLVVGQLSVFSQNVTAGRGWVAIALVIFGRWNPLLVVAGAFLFGVTDALQLRIQAAGGGINATVPYELFQALPYVVTLVVMVAGTAWARRSAQPAALGIPFRKEASV